MKLFLALLIVSSVSLAAQGPMAKLPCSMCKKPAAKVVVKPNPKPSPVKQGHYGRH